MRITMTRNNEATTYTDEAGKFASGNPGRPKGARHKVTQAVEALLEGQASELTQTAIDKALAGDMTALRLCMERIAPARKDSPVSFDLPPMKSTSDAVAAAQAVLGAVSCGDVTPLEGATVMGLIEQYRRVLETSELEERLAALEERAEK
jgi:hypothetical protein